MPSLPTIKRISILRGTGVFRNYSAPAEGSDLKRYNLVYGFNGSGKTTLSRVLACLEFGALRPELPGGSQFEIELTDGTIITSTGELDRLKGRLTVFNVDYIEDSLRWKDGMAKPVFYLGKAQADLATTLQEIETAIVALEAKRAQVVSEHKIKENAYTTHKRDAARLIAEEVGLGRKYDATNLVADYEQASYNDELKLSENDRQHLRAIINQRSPLPKCNLINIPVFDVGTLIKNVRAILEATIGAIALQELQQHESMLNWVKEGIDYHEEHGLASCLLCGNELTSERRASLRQTINSTFDQLANTIIDTKETAEMLRDRMGEAVNIIPSINDISKDLQGEFSASAEILRTTLTRGVAIVTSAVSVLDEKAAMPSASIDPGGIPTVAEAMEWDTAAKMQLSALNAVLEKHNRSHDEFSSTQETARKRVKDHFLADGQTQYKLLGAEVTTAKSSMDALEVEHRTKTLQAERLKRDLREHGPAAEMMNRMIHAYLGHKELQIATLENGYEIRRHGKPVTGSLSESEKTAIALCYFLSSLEAEGRQLKNLIVVVDDPISSLDTKALHYAFNLIRGALEEVSQLLILTHNLHFMNEVKKWLKNRADRDEPTASLLFLDTVQDGKTDTRCSSVQRMPKLIRDYESEYQYLFYHVLRFARSANNEAEYLYLMPNALRKVLEIFLAFKLPGTEGLKTKVDNIAGDTTNLDPARIRALDRLVQLESHADNLDDLVTFSSMTIEETKDAARALLTLMETIDKPHYDRLCRICS